MSTIKLIGELRPDGLVNVSSPDVPLFHLALPQDSWIGDALPILYETLKRNDRNKPDNVMVHFVDLPT